jgi:hypothetical protein
MSERSNDPAAGGVGIGTVLFLIFMTLKLTGHIDWSWWWVTAPLWIPTSFVLLIFGGLFGYTWFCEWQIKRAERRG